MKLLVIQEQHFTELPNGEIWADKQSDVRFWDRYLNVFDELVVCARLKKSDTLTAKALRSDRKEVSFVGMPEFRGVIGIIKHYFKIQKALFTALKQVDCVVFRAPSPISMVSYAIVRLSRKPFAVELMNNPRTHFSAHAMHNWYQPLIACFITNQTERMCRKANGVSYVTQKALQELYPSTAKLKGESDRYFEASYSTINLSKANFIKQDWAEERPEPIVFVHSGEMVDYRKGQNVFIVALSELKQRGYNVKGIMIGDGEKRAEFEELAKSKDMHDEIDFVGWKSGFDNVQKELLKGHVFVFPSRGEGLPWSVIEAMASGMLCFGSNVDGIPELLDPTLLVDEFDGKAFADRIEPYLKDWKSVTEKREELFQRSKEYENTKLTHRRNEFYSKLRNVSKR